MDYEVIRSGRKTFSAQIRGGRLFVRVPAQAADEQIEQFLYSHRKWISAHLEKARREQNTFGKKLEEDEIQRLLLKAQTVLEERTAHFAPIVGVDYGRVRAKKLRSRWGSCNAKGELSFNFLLILTPPEVLDSVVVHELCHRKVMDHSDRFYDEVLRVCPDYRSCSRWLKENGQSLLARL